MNSTEEQLKVIEEMAELYFTPDEIATNLEVDPILLAASLLDPSTPEAKAFTGGTLKGDIQLRKSISQAARNGSNPAQQMMITFRLKSKINFR